MAEAWHAIIDARPMFAMIAGVAALLTLIIARKVPAFPALLTAALFTGLAAGLAPMTVIASVQTGMGGVLGFIAVIVGLGALLGVFLEASGGAKALALSLIDGRSTTTATITMGFVGILIAIPVFFDVGLILLFPLVRALAKKAGRPALRFGLPLLAGLAAAHAFIPPTPGPIAVAEILSADIGLVILVGIAAGVPAMLIAGPIFAGFAEEWKWLGTNSLQTDEREYPGHIESGLAGRAALAIIMPLLLIVLAAIVTSGGFHETMAGSAITFIGHPFVALLLACALAHWVLKPQDNDGRMRLKEGLQRAFEPTAAIILVTGAGGAFKQVLIDTGAGEALSNVMLSSGIAPITAGFVLAGLIRAAQGSATVAMLTAAGLTAPIATAAGLGQLDLALMTVAIAAGATIISHVNDSGFWLVSKYFDLSVADTLRTWTISSTLVGCIGFVVILIINLAI